MGCITVLLIVLFIIFLVFAGVILWLGLPWWLVIVTFIPWLLSLYIARHPGAFGDSSGSGGSNSDDIIEDAWESRREWEQRELEEELDDEEDGFD